MSDDQKKHSHDAEESAPQNGHRDEAEETLRKRVEEGLERLVPEVVKRTLEAGLGTISRSDKGRLRSLVNDLRLPRDVARYFLVQFDDTKNALLRVFAKEVRDFLEHTDLAEDLRRVLTAVSLEVSARVSFVPNESATGIRPDVSAKIRAADRRVHRSRKDKDERTEG